MRIFQGNRLLLLSVVLVALLVTPLVRAAENPLYQAGTDAQTNPLYETKLLIGDVTVAMSSFGGLETLAPVVETGVARCTDGECVIAHMHNSIDHLEQGLKEPLWSDKEKQAAALKLVQELREAAHELTHVVQQRAQDHNSSRSNKTASAALSDLLDEADGDGEVVELVRSEVQEVITGFTQLEDILQLRAVGGGNDSYVRKRPGRVKYGNITLERAVTKDPTLATWQAEAAASRSGRTVFLVIQDRTGAETARYELTGAWPVSYSLIDRNGRLFEKIELAVEKIERAR